MRTDEELDERTYEEVQAAANEAMEYLDSLLNDEPGCETIYGPCSEPVAWRHIRTCCGRMKLLCDKHKRNHERITAAERSIRWICGHCHKPSVNDYIPV